MKKYLLVLILLAAYCYAHSQAFQPNNSPTNFIRGTKNDTILIMPRGCDTVHLAASKFGQNTIGAQYWDTCNNVLYVKDTYKWVAITGGLDSTLAATNTVLFAFNNRIYGDAGFIFYPNLDSLRHSGVTSTNTLRITEPTFTSDTTGIKILTIDPTNGEVSYLTYWPGGSGGLVADDVILNQDAYQTGKRFSIRSGRFDSVYSRTATGLVIGNSNNDPIAWFGLGASTGAVFQGFTGYNSNISANYTARSFTDKNYVDSQANVGWKTIGNSGLNSSTNFIGTNDDVDFVIKRNTETVGRFTSSGLSLGPLSGLNQTNFSNVFIGSRAGRNITSGSSNVVIGIYNSSSQMGATSAGNTHIGNAAAFGNTAVLTNTTFIGASSGTSATGANNTGIGSNALKSSSGYNNIGIGYYASTNGNSTNNAITGNNNIAIGAGTKIIDSAASNQITFWVNASTAGASGYNVLSRNSSGQWVFNQTTSEVTSISSGAALEINGTTGYILPPRLTAAQRTALTPTAGLFGWDSDSLRFMGYTGSAWKGVKWTDEGGGSSGITSLNGLTGATQTFAVGTSGTDFAISSSGTTHTFNLPTASASNRGALSTTDWATFNNKQVANDPQVGTLGADVTMTSATTWYSGPTVTLGVGTWHVNAQVTVAATIGGYIEVRQYDGSTADGGGNNITAASRSSTATGFAEWVVASGTKTITVQAMSSVATSTLKATTVLGSTPGATKIMAIRVE